ncbi:hypothetical protein QVD17_42410 [Tagetes erecta]|uniref:Uncharacterized protein n=1 Tax=Tagetes erecta TaxID=13708 RepID=A0AAD8JNT5_TARER|nr:hypothetical protein QVD17_42410 [Tagetes erecta]
MQLTSKKCGLRAAVEALCCNSLCPSVPQLASCPVRRPIPHFVSDSPLVVPTEQSSCNRASIEMERVE